MLAMVDRVGASTLKGWQMAGLATPPYREHCFRPKCPRKLMCQKPNLQTICQWKLAE